jgi:preprotein translocase subunit YajC
MTTLHVLALLPLLADAPPPRGGLFASPFFMLFLMIVMFYFLLIRPQQRQRKEQQARIAALETGDKVVTSAGIHGLVHNVRDHTVMVKVAEGTMIEFDKMAIAAVHKKESSK